MMPNEESYLKSFACIFFGALFTILVFNYGTYPVKEYVYIRDTLYIYPQDTLLFPRDPNIQKKVRGRKTIPAPWWH